MNQTHFVYAAEYIKTSLLNQIIVTLTVGIKQFFGKHFGLFFCRKFNFGRNFLFSMLFQNNSFVISTIDV